MKQIIYDYKARLVCCTKDAEKAYKCFMLYRAIPISLWFVIICLVLWLA